MFRDFLKSVWARAKAKRIANAISPGLLASSRIVFVLDRYRGRILDALARDEFVLSRFQGAIGRAIEMFGVTDNETIGYVFWATFDRIFPGNGRSILDLCNKRLREGDEAFKQGLNSGWQEIEQSIKTGGKLGLASIYERIDQLEMELYEADAEENRKDG